MKHRLIWKRLPMGQRLDEAEAAGEARPL